MLSTIGPIVGAFQLRNEGHGRIFDDEKDDLHFATTDMEIFVNTF